MIHNFLYYSSIGAYALLAVLVVLLVTVFPQKNSNANSFSSSVLDPVFGSSGSFSLVSKLTLAFFLCLVIINLGFNVLGEKSWIWVA